MLWASQLAKRVTYKTVRNYVRAVRHYHVEHGLCVSIFGSLTLNQLLKGIRRKYGDQVRPRTLPVTTRLLQRIRSAGGPVGTKLVNALDKNMIMAAMSIATNGLFRIGELFGYTTSPKAVPTMSQLTFHTNHITIHLVRSKTDQFGEGVDVKVANAAAIEDLCTYLTACSPQAREPHRPLFAWHRDGNPLTRRALLSFATQSLKFVGVDLSMARGISFRRGGATSLAAAGIPDRIIKILGRWKSMVFVRYVDTDTSELVAASAAT